MKTRYMDMKEHIDPKDLALAAKAIQKGELVAFPTETVYGLGADALNEEAVAKIFKAKKRPMDNPLIVHISDMAQLSLLTDEVNDLSKRLMAEFWPGALTILFKKSNRVPKGVTAGLDTVAVRMPQNEIAKKLIEAAKVPIAAPSANVSGRPSPTKAWHVQEDLDGEIAAIIDGGDAKYGLESTVIDVLGKPYVLRPGSVTLEMLRAIEPAFALDPALKTGTQKPKSPGQKYRHYAPKAAAELYVMEKEGLILALKERLKAVSGKKIGLMLCTETIRCFVGEGYNIIDMGSRDLPAEASFKIFDAFRTLDNWGAELILIEGFQEEGVGLSLMNRLVKAAGGKVYGEEEMF